MTKQKLTFYITEIKEEESERIVTVINMIIRDTNIWAPLPPVVLTRKHMVTGDKIWISLCQTNGNRNPIFKSVVICFL